MLVRERMKLEEAKPESPKKGKNGKVDEKQAKLSALKAKKIHSENIGNAVNPT